MLRYNIECPNPRDSKIIDTDSGESFPVCVIECLDQPEDFVEVLYRVSPDRRNRARIGVDFQLSFKTGLFDRFEQYIYWHDIVYVLEGINTNSGYIPPGTFLAVFWKDSQSKTIFVPLLRTSEHSVSVLDIDSGFEIYPKNMSSLIVVGNKFQDFETLNKSKDQILDDLHPKEHSFKVSVFGTSKQSRELRARLEALILKYSEYTLTHFIDNVPINFTKGISNEGK